jgi:hypothetical protein
MAMSFIALLMCEALLAAQAAVTEIEPEHAKNAIYESVRTSGMKSEGTVAQLPAPLFHDGMPGPEQHAVLLKLLGSTKALDDFFEPGVAAPIKSKLHDWQGTTGTIRGFDIYFAVHANLDQIKPDDIDGQSKKKTVTDSGGMHFEGRLLDGDELKKLELAPAGESERFGKIECALLEKVEAKMTNRSLSTQSKRAMVVAIQTLSNPAGDGASRNVWRTVDHRAGKMAVGPWQPYSGLIAYTKITQLDFRPETLFVEIHGAFAEPKRWFNGRGILKSKITIVANDKIRDLRREVAKRREKGAEPAS